MPSLLHRTTGWVGRRTSNFVLYLFDLAAFAVKALSAWLRHNPFNPAVREALVTQLIFAGLDALPVIGLLAVAAGVSITYQLIAIVRLVSEPQEVVNLLTQMVVLELGSLLTAIVLTGRSGAAIAVDLGNMQLRREIEGLELLGIDVYDLLITPRLIGTALAQLALAVYFSLIALVFGIGVSALLISSGVLNYLLLLPYAFHPYDVLLFAGKNFGYGLLIGTSACFNALRVERSPSELPQQTLHAFVSSLLLIFLVDGMIAVLR